MSRMIGLFLIAFASTACAENPDEPVEISVSDGKTDGEAGAHATLTQTDPEANFTLRCNEWFSCAAAAHFQVGDSSWTYPTPTYAFTIDVYRLSDAKRARFQLYGWREPGSSVDNTRLVTLSNPTEIDATNDIVVIHDYPNTDGIQMLSSDPRELWEITMKRAPWGTLDKLYASVWAKWE